MGRGDIFQKRVSLDRRRSCYARPSSRSGSSMSSHLHHPTTVHIVGVHYRVGQKIGEGSFGIIYEGKSPPASDPAFRAHLTGFHRYKSPELTDRGHKVCSWCPVLAHDSVSNLFSAGTSEGRGTPTP